MRSSGSAGVSQDNVNMRARLGEALHANRAGSTVEHVLIALPSYSVSESLLSHYGDRIPSLEHRYLPAMFAVSRIPTCSFVFVSTAAPSREVIDHYVSLVPEARRDDVRRRTTIVEVPADGSSVSVAGRLAKRDDLLERIRAIVSGRPALIEPWNVTEHEVALSRLLDIPVNGTDPGLRPLGFKSAGRRIFREADVPVPFGIEDVRTVDDVVAAIMAIRAARPNAEAVVVKHDDSGAGDGNVVIRVPDARDGAMDAAVRRTVEALPAWYLDDLARGGVVEERIAGTEFSSPSCQVDVAPDGSVRVLATHEQVLGGADGQVYLGCRFPAAPGYAPELADHAEAIGRAYAERGAMGRLAIDFVAARGAGDGAWRVYAIEVNLRKGGTTHPYAVLRNLVPGRYDPAAGVWIADRDGRERCYSASDNVVDERWVGVAPSRVIDAVARAGLQFDPDAGTGVVLHMLAGLAIDGRFGLTAIGRTSTEAAAMHEQVVAAVHSIIR